MMWRWLPTTSASAGLSPRVKGQNLPKVSLVLGERIRCSRDSKPVKPSWSCDCKRGGQRIRCRPLAMRCIAREGPLDFGHLTEKLETANHARDHRCQIGILILPQKILEIHDVEVVRFPNRPSV